MNDFVAKLCLFTAFTLIGLGVAYGAWAVVDMSRPDSGLISGTMFFLYLMNATTTVLQSIVPGITLIIAVRIYERSVGRST